MANNKKKIIIMVNENDNNLIVVPNLISCKKYLVDKNVFKNIEC